MDFLVQPQDNLTGLACDLLCSSQGDSCDQTCSMSLDKPCNFDCPTYMCGSDGAFMV